MNETILGLTARIVAAHIANNTLQTDQLPALIREVHRALATVGEAPAEPAKAEPAVEVRKSVFSDHLVCLACGGSFKTLKWHLMSDHELTPEQVPVRSLGCHVGIQWFHLHTLRCGPPYPRKSALGIGEHRRRLAGSGGDLARPPVEAPV